MSRYSVRLVPATISANHFRSIVVVMTSKCFVASSSRLAGAERLRLEMTPESHLNFTEGLYESRSSESN